MDPTTTDACTPYPPSGPDGTPLSFPSEWRTEAVLGLAFGIRADGAFDRMPILADALEEAGCANLLILNHCRHCERHTPECWVIECALSGDQELWMDATAIAAGQTFPLASDAQPTAFRRLGDADEIFPISARLILVGVVVMVVFGLFQVFRTLVLGPPNPPSSGVTGTAPASPSPSPPSPRR